MRDEWLARRHESSFAEDTRPHTSVHPLDELRVLTSDLVVELEQLVDPRLVDVGSEEVIEESGGSIRPRREDRPARQVRMAREDVDPEVRPDEVELAPCDLVPAERGRAPIAQRSELARRQPLRFESV